VDDTAEEFEVCRICLNVTEGKSRHFD